MDVFNVHEKVISDYSEYVQSFLSVADEKAKAFINEKLIAERKLWPEALIQLNPAYEKAGTVEQLAEAGRLHPECAEIFRDKSGQSFHLYRHQQEAIERALQHEPYVVTSGTGSGKTMTYFIPIFDAILRGDPSESKVWAIIVYPMNALVNSQEQALKELAQRYQERTGRPMPVRFARYTGQESQEEKQKHREHPPHILLTNYVMLELMLVRPREAQFVDKATTNLQYLVLDELHTYRGRQGADVALLIRRLRERSGNPNLLCIGTSATMATGATRQERLRAVADFAAKLFGVQVSPGNVVEETLRRVIPRNGPVSPEHLRASLSSLPAEEWGPFASHPLTTWIEDTFGLKEEEGDLRRQQPISLREGAKRLSEQTGTEEKECLRKLQELLLIGSQVEIPDGSTAFAFKLHQFISQGGSIYATLEQPEERLLTLDGQYYAPGEGERLLYPLVFCRVCGQEYYAVRMSQQGQFLCPDTTRMVELLDDEEADTAERGYVMIDPDGRFDDNISNLPEHWLTPAGKVNKDYRSHQPRQLFVRADGSVEEQSNAANIRTWFQPRPFMLCLNCGEAYTRRDKNDFRKLARLSSEGRSTATTLLGLSTVAAMRQTDLDPEAQKVLSFTDNRQDASLQAGHMNDFIQVALVRSALYQALQEHNELHFENIAQQVVQAMGFELDDYARQAGLIPTSRQAADTRDAFFEVVEYRLYEDLKRGWRLVQPNLEQCGLLQIGYKGLESLSADVDAWRDLPWMQQASADQRDYILRILLDEMRRQLTIDVPCLKEGHQKEIRRRAAEYLKTHWAFDEHERLKYASMYIRPGDRRAPGDFSVSTKSVIGRWLKNQIQLATGEAPDTGQYDQIINAILDALVGFGLLIEEEEGSGRYQHQGLRLRPSALIWRPGDGTVTMSPLRRYRAEGEGYQEIEHQANRYFRDYYSSPVTLDSLQHMEAAEHTAQISAEDRIEREDRFREGELPVLFCSPTMELGVDIADLNAVHLRNIPPTPANYAQRSGRSGRAGQPALVLGYCSIGSGHDQYYFRNRARMVQGVVVPPRIELSNEDLIRSHMHAIWLAKTAIQMKHSILEIVDTGQEGKPLLPEIKTLTNLSQTAVQACIAECQQVLNACGLDKHSTEWLSENWVADQITYAPTAFDQAFDRWRELFTLAWNQLLEAQQMRQLALLSHGSEAREKAKQAAILEWEAQRQLDLLRCENLRAEESDFYPYRYLASEGFLPGYNFPALPVRAYVAKGPRDGEFIGRPRFLALSEFGPHNIIYHDGAKYAVNQVMLPVQDPEKRFTRAKLCDSCGYLHEGEAAHLDMCENCSSALTNANSRYLESLLQMPTAATIRRERITCDEEERLRRGFEISTHFRFSFHQGLPRRWLAHSEAPAGERLLSLVYAPAADLWRINHKWRRQVEDIGYRLDMKNGRWLRQGIVAPSDNEQSEIRSNVRLYVRDTANALLVYPPPAKSEDEPFIATLQYALAQGIQETYQVEESELSSERLGEANQRGILFWEAAEGGLGVLRHLVETPSALAQVAAAALRTCHFDPEGIDLRPPEDEESGCARACYDCLLSYYNQRDHLLLDRHQVRDFLLQLVASTTQIGSAERDHQAHYRYLYAQTDPESELERQFLSYLFEHNFRLPDYAQCQLENVYTVPDFFYDPNICIFCDGTVHDEAQQKAQDAQVRQELKDRGYRVIVYRYDSDLASLLLQYKEVFGTGD